MSIVIENLQKQFGAKTVLEQVCFSISGPVLLTGPSGCGKTTLLRILMGLERPGAGTVRGVGRVGAVFQEDRLCPQLTAVQNICLTAGGLPPAQAEQELRALGFTAADCALPAARLSGGQKRRAALLRALLCQKAETLLLDEPFTGMDAPLLRRAAAATDRLAAGRDTILVSHDRSLPELLRWPVLSLEPAAKP